MNVCLFCGKETKNPKFCSSSCAAKCNNVKRLRHKGYKTAYCVKCGCEIIINKHASIKNCVCDKCKVINTSKTTNKSKNIKGDNICKFCGRDSGLKTTCEECRPYVYRLKTFAKFGLNTGTLKERNDEMCRILYNEYYLNKKSTCQIEEERGVSHQSIQNVLNRELSGCRCLSESVCNAIQNDRTSYIKGEHISWEGNVYQYRSSWEEKFMCELDQKRIKYRYEPFYVKYFNTTKNKFMFACPDFYLIDSNEIIELKSTYTYIGEEQNMKDKFKAYIELGYKPKLLLDRKYIDIL